MRLLFAADKSPWPGTTGARVRIARLWEAFSPDDRHFVLWGRPSPEEADALAAETLGRFTVVDPASGDPSAALDREAERAGCQVIWVSGAWIGRAGGRRCGRPVVLDSPGLAARQLRCELASHASMMSTGSELRRLASKLAHAPGAILTERRAWRVCDMITPCSEPEKARLPEPIRRRSTVVPNGCDVRPFRERQPEAPRIVFVGTLHYAPNAEAALLLAEKIAPRLRREHPDLRVDIVGAGPEPICRRLGQSGTVAVHGFVEDLDPLYATASHAVIPIRRHTGTNVKVLEAMAHGVPVVTTSAGLEGFEALVPDSDVAVGRSWAECADLARGLLADPGRSRSMATSAWRRVTAEYGWDRARDALREAAARLVAQR